ncbi:hypothetical protein Syun_001986 [Stephania yunnanensis]|uniref:Uncharacterized protein n=1 Tax=Stephania yunnanensis TaxID=152371 RepID=A0AAP0LF39_9MAGN
MGGVVIDKIEDWSPRSYWDHYKNMLQDEWVKIEGLPYNMWNGVAFQMIRDCLVCHKFPIGGEGPVSNFRPSDEGVVEFEFETEEGGTGTGAGKGLNDKGDGKHECEGDRRIEEVSSTVPKEVVNGSQLNDNCTEIEANAQGGFQ